MKRLKQLVLAALTLPIASYALADTIYPTDKKRSMFADRRAHTTGDVVTVIIAESTTAIQSADVDMKRSGEASAKGGEGLWGLMKLIPRASLGGSTAQKGSGSTTRNSRLTTTITCRVIEVTSTGQLVIRGDRTVKINEDVQTLRFSGIARFEDVMQDNSISSNVIADAQIEVFGKGPVDRHTKPGLLGRVFEFLF
ncbi:flagellar basal body L-ring protein FlgH [Armatimonas sp.]|uniref:flagellar basal body L-ring protein FlgH n=1 Tax=Armatimonas sp. TaxID=1872638 RepID=UPI00286BA38F|nr:flagellar basal body L-ring protein FlgH [Armatimonas sp.]